MRRPAVHWLAGAALTAAAGCQTVAPALTSLLVAFGQDLLAATAVNHTPRYAVEVENLLTVLARHATGLEFQNQLLQAGYQPPPPKYAQTDQSGYAQQSGYGQYGQSGSYGQQDSYEQTGSYGQTDPSSYDDPYAAQPPQAAPGDPNAGTAQSGGYGYGQATYAGGYTPPADSGYQDPYTIPAGGYQTRSASAGPVSLGVALLARRAGTTTLATVEDGDTLRDGRGDPGRGDLLRVHFQSNCACWVYVIGIDATGYVAQIFPDPDSSLGNPVTAGRNYLLPDGDQWWGLDDQRGIEQVYFVAAREPRPDIEAAIARLAAQPRQLATAEYRPVSEPAIVPGTRGLVKVAVAAPVEVPVSNAAPAQVTPAIFTNEDDDTDLVITRWFRHE